MVRRILVPLDPSDYSRYAVRTAVTVAKRQGAQITGLGIVDQPGIERSEVGAPAGAIYYAEKAVEHRVDEARRTVVRLFEEFRESCEKAGVPHQEQERVGDPIDVLQDESRYHDLIVTGLRSAIHFATEEKKEKNLDEILRHSIAPVLAVPKRTFAIKKTLIAYDGSLPAARSLQRFAHLALVAELDIKLLTATDEEDEGIRLLSRAEEYLRFYGAGSVTSIVRKGDISDVIMNEFADAVDLVVLGMHSRVPVFDFVVGSLTKSLIKHGELALFLSQ